MCCRRQQQQLRILPQSSHSLYWSRGASSTTSLRRNTEDDYYPSSTLVPKFAVVRHDGAYRAAMAGLHGKQLALALLEGEGKDEPDFDPFLEEELEEARLLAEAEEIKRGGASSSSTQKETIDDENDVEDDTETNDQQLDPSSSLYQHKLNRKKYNNDGSIKRNKSEMAILRAGSPAGGLVAIIALAGTQFKVTTDDVVIVNLLKPVSVYKVGSIQTLRDEKVLLVTSSALTLVGMPYVPGAEVDILIEEITQDAKIVIFKKRRRKNSKRKTGFRRDVTMLRIVDIRFPPPYETHEHVPRPDPAPLIPK
jgi:large subunit ribosomal protein L21